MTEKINLRGGKTLNNSLEIDFNEVLQKQIGALREGHLQIGYGDKYLVDVSFAAKAGSGGCFKIMVIRQQEWDCPIWHKEVEANEFLLALQECIDFAVRARSGSAAIETLDLKGGKITLDDFCIDLDMGLEHQMWEIKEDLLRIEYHAGRYLVDVSFRPEFDPKGSFYIVVIKDYDWDEPLLLRCVAVSGVLAALRECIDFAAAQSAG